MNKVTIFNEMFSSNLGDQVIAQSTEYLIKRVSGYHVQILDLSGRSGIGPATSTQHSGMLRSLTSIGAGLIPLPFKNELRWRRKYNVDLRDTWRKAVSESELVIIGGGQLLMDNSMYFPVRINTLTNLCQELTVPHHLFACGVGARWSPKAARYLRQSLSTAASISVRDFESRQSVGAMRGHNRDVDVIGDPALFAADAYQQHQAKDTRRIGLGITAGSELAKRHPPYSSLDIVAYWVELSKRLVADGHFVTLFCNGSVADYETLLAVYAQVRLPEVRVIKRPLSAGELVRSLAKFRVIVSHRLHASIIGTSLGVPTVGIEWDTKVRSFYARTSRLDYILAANPSVSATLRCISDAYETELDYRPVAAMKEATLQMVARITGKD